MTPTSSQSPVEQSAPRAKEPSVSDAAEGLGASERGVVMVEYVTLLCLVTVTGAATVVALGVPLMQLFRYVQMVIAMPIP